MNLPTYIRKAEYFGEAAERILCSRRLKRAIWGVIIFSIIYFAPAIISIIHK
jgi:hypothetical protein